MGDCQQTGQLWLHCADVKILQADGQPAPPTPAPAPTPAPPTPAPGVCTVEESDRRDCGFPGIDEAGCVDRGCCWKSSGVQGVPWCYYADGDAQPTPTPAPTTPAPTTVAPTPVAPSPAAQCSVDDSDRQECGYSGVDEAGCIERDCCWKSSATFGVPWCFAQAGGSTTPAPTLPPSPPVNRCDVPESQRQDCGFFGIDQSGCEGEGCCWRESSSGAPWCYFGA